MHLKRVSFRNLDNKEPKYDFQQKHEIQPPPTPHKPIQTMIPLSCNLKSTYGRKGTH